VVLPSMLRFATALNVPLVVAGTPLTVRLIVRPSLVVNGPFVTGIAIGGPPPIDSVEGLGVNAELSGPTAFDAPGPAVVGFGAPAAAVGDGQRVLTHPAVGRPAGAGAGRAADDRRGRPRAGLEQRVARRADRRPEPGGHLDRHRGVVTPVADPRAASVGLEPE